MNKDKKEAFMNWEDEGIILSAKPLMEKTIVLSLLTQKNGLHKGVVRLTKRIGSIEPGNCVHAIWKARLSMHLGTYMIEVNDTPIARIMTQANRLLLLKTVTTLLDMLLPERHPYVLIYEYVKEIFASLHHMTDPLFHYVRFEHLLIHEMGFGFDLSKCALCGKVCDLFYLSPKSGRGACDPCGGPYKDKLFYYPWGFFDLALRIDDAEKKKSMLEMLKITGFFLSEYAIKQVGASAQMPIIREQMLEAFK